MTRKPPRRTAEQWQSLVAEQRRSGLSMAAFCRREDLVYQSFVAQARRVPIVAAADERTDAEPALSALPEFVEIGTTRGSSASASSSPWLVELDLGEGIQLRVRRPN